MLLHRKCVAVDTFGVFKVDEFLRCGVLLLYYETSNVGVFRQPNVLHMPGVRCGTVSFCSPSRAPTFVEVVKVKVPVSRD